MTRVALIFGLLAAPAVAADPADFFETKVRPVLAEHCYSCHGEKKQSGRPAPGHAARRS